MKKIILGLAVVATFAACKSNKSEEKVHVVLVQDTSMLYNNSVLTDRNQGAYATTIGAAVATAPVTTEKKNHSTNVTNSSSANTNSGSVATNTVPAKKKGLSHKARGAIVGAGTGAITGALINKKNRGLGAVIGGVVGAATGFVIGNEVDKKKNRP